MSSETVIQPAPASAPVRVRHRRMQEAGLIIVIVILGLLVAVSGALEEFFRYGERWRHYRQTVEWLKIEGWRFFQLSDPYRKFTTHAEAYSDFAGRVEDVIRRDVNVYVSEIVRTKEEKEDKSDQDKDTAKKS